MNLKVLRKMMIFANCDNFQVSTENDALLRFVCNDDLQVSAKEWWFFLANGIILALDEE